MNLVILSTPRALGKQKLVTKVFWADVLVAAFSIRNRATCDGMTRDKTPLELWTERKPEVSFYLVISSPSWYHIRRGQDKTIWDKESRYTDRLRRTQKWSQIMKLCKPKSRFTGHVSFDENVVLFKSGNETIETNIVEKSILNITEFNPVRNLENITNSDDPPSTSVTSDFSVQLEAAKENWVVSAPPDWSLSSPNST